MYFLPDKLEGIERSNAETGQLLSKGLFYSFHQSGLQRNFFPYYHIQIISHFLSLRHKVDDWPNRE